jgi:hypothetical protein
VICVDSRVYREHHKAGGATPKHSALHRLPASMDLPRPPRAANIAVTVIVGLGLTVLINGALARRAERDHSPKGAFIEVDVVRLHYIERVATDD